MVRRVVTTGVATVLLVAGLVTWSMTDVPDSSSTVIRPLPTGPRVDQSP